MKVSHFRRLAPLAVLVVGCFIAATLALKTDAASAVGALVLLCIGIVLGGIALYVFMTPLNAKRKEAARTAGEEGESIAEPYEQAQKQLAELQHAHRMRADFTAMIVHDLRSPLSVVMGAATTLADGLIGPINDEQKKWLGKIAANSRRLMEFVTAFLDLSKIEAGHVQLHKEEVDLPRLLGNTIDDYLVLARNKNISLVTRLDPDLLSIYADGWRLEQLLSNLVSNAIKFTPEGGRIEIGAAHDRVENVTLWVKDNGSGIPAQDIERVFEMYRSAGGANDPGYEGTGLGLAICKMIVEAHRGKIWIESAERAGTTFFCSLPASSQENTQGRLSITA
ncbi:MAG TPA: ATP-binding protein [Candidatus Binatia bacterium]